MMSIIMSNTIKTIIMSNTIKTIIMSNKLRTKELNHIYDLVLLLFQIS